MTTAAHAWPPDMFALPDGSAISKSLRPCRCGGRERVVVLGPKGYAVWCRACYGDRRPGRDRGERVVGTLDSANWRIVPTGRETHGQAR